MTVETQATKTVYVGNGASTVWTYGFLIPMALELRVSLVNNSSGNASIINPVNYAVTGIGVTAGGSVTYPLSGSPVGTGFSLVLERVMPYTQEITFANQGAAYPADIEDGLDILTLQIQQLADTQRRSIVFSVADTVAQTLPLASARANLQLGFDSLGNPIAVAGILPNVQVSSAMIPVVTAATTADALTALGLPGALLNLLIPSGVEWDYNAGGTAPTGFVYPIGQPCTSIYPDYRAKLIAASSPYGSNGTDPLMPDKRSVVNAGKSNMGGTDNGLLPGGTVLGAILGTASGTLLQSNLPNVTLTFIGTANQPISVTPSNGGVFIDSRSSTTVQNGTGAGIGVPSSVSPTGNGVFTATGTLSPLNGGVTQTQFSRLQPTFVCNKILKVH